MKVNASHAECDDLTNAYRVDDPGALTAMRFATIDRRRSTLHSDHHHQNPSPLSSE
jgi:hypothetical protein